MRRIIIPVVTVLLLLPAVDAAFAQDEDVWLRSPFRFGLSVTGGVGMPLGPGAFNDLWNSSFPATVSLGYVVIPYVEVRGWFTFASWGISEIPAMAALGVGDRETGEPLKEISGGGITTIFYGGSVKLIPFPNSRMYPYLDIGGGYFEATADNLDVTQAEHVIQSNSMKDVNGSALRAVLGLEYGLNERVDVITEFDYYVGFGSDFAPGDLVLQKNAEPTQGDNLLVGALVLGITIKF